MITNKDGFVHLAELTERAFLERLAYCTNNDEPEDNENLFMSELELVETEVVS